MALYNGTGYQEQENALDSPFFCLDLGEFVFIMHTNFEINSQKCTFRQQKIPKNYIS